MTVDQNQTQQTYIESAKEVAGKAIGKHGLIYITIIVAMGVGASVVLEEGKMAATVYELQAIYTQVTSMSVTSMWVE